MKSGRQEHSNQSPVECLAFIFRPRLVLALVMGHPIEDLVLRGVRYQDAGYGEWTGFYDWLRDKKETILGVRYWPDTPAVIEKLDGLAYTKIDKKTSSIEIYLSDNRDVAKEKSHDQDFLFDRVFVSSDGQLAIAFDVSLLTAGQLEEIGSRTDADWIE